MFKKRSWWIFIFLIIILIVVLSYIDLNGVRFSTDPNFEVEPIPCDSDEQCPAGWRCHEGMCVSLIIPGTDTSCTGECYICLFNAIRQVESGGEPEEGCDAIGDDGQSCGPYQIQEAYCNDAKVSCNLPGGQDCCELNSVNWNEALCQPCNGNAACCEEKKRISELKMSCYFRRYTKNFPLQCPEGGSGPSGTFTCEDLGRMHNGGPCGHRNPNTAPYWNQVKQIMQQTCPQCLEQQDKVRDDAYVR